MLGLGDMSTAGGSGVAARVNPLYPSSRLMNRIDGLPIWAALLNLSHSQLEPGENRLF